MTLHAYQQYDSAARVYALAQMLEPKRLDWLYLRGAVQMESGEFEDARTSFQSALDLAPGTLAAQLRLAQASIALNRLQDALALYREILQKDAGCARAWYGLGRVQAAMGDHAGAIQSYTKACDLFTEYGAAHFALAQEMRRLGQPGEAQRHMQAYAANPTAEPTLEDPLIQRVSELNHGAQAHMQRAAELEKAGRLEDAVHEQEAALAADPVNVQAHVNLIALYGRTGNPEKAREQFEAAVRLSPGARTSGTTTVSCFFGMAAPLKKPRRAFRRALEINPDNGEARDNLGVIYERRGRLDDAAREFRQAIASRPDYPPRTLSPRPHFGQPAEI